MTTSNDIAGSADDPWRERQCAGKGEGPCRSGECWPLSRSPRCWRRPEPRRFPDGRICSINFRIRCSSGSRDTPQTPVLADDQAQAERFFAQQALPSSRRPRERIRMRSRGRWIRWAIDRQIQRRHHPFIADLRSWSTTYQIFLKSVVGWWHGDESLANYVDGRFRRHLFSDQTIADDVRNALVQLDEDLEANRNQLS